MKPNLSKLGPRAAVFLFLAAGCVSVASAQGRFERPGPRERGPREHVAPVPREHFATPHWRFDNRFHHDHYYPQIGYSVAALPAGHVAITFRGSPFFFHAGVWYRRSGPSFIVVRPPIGIIVPVLPPAYSTVWVGTLPYYYADDVFYEQVPGGYSVVEAPAGYVEQGPVGSPPPMQAAAPTAAAASPGGSTWYYCDSSKTYYPYVSECKEGWRAVPATPPGR
jgi:uncharacterized protein DUF6515